MLSTKSTVFISHSQNDPAAYTSLCLAFDGQHISYWDPKSMAVGASLREQLKAGIAKCDACIFVATRNSLESKWCLAEIGAFWGIGKRVVIFIADSQVHDDEIPPQFHGDLWTRDVREVVRVIKAELAEAAQKKEEQLKEKPVLVSEMTSDMLYALISS